MKKRGLQRKKFLKRVEKLEKKYRIRICSIDGWHELSYYDVQTGTDDLRREEIMNPQK
ncbi:hypothetical protein [Sporosarcina psychrophila]|uniref:Fur-regulated basic protein FbpA n=1 Tax=Sporosarcina psychrophila TaxID=1476 RepID=A0ABV2KBX9_SPOPS